MENKASWVDHGTTSGPMGRNVCHAIRHENQATERRLVSFALGLWFAMRHKAWSMKHEAKKQEAGSRTHNSEA